MTPTPDLNGLGFYVLAGAPRTPVDLLGVVVDPTT